MIYLTVFALSFTTQNYVLHCLGVEKDETINMESFQNLQRTTGSFEENEEKGYKWQYEG